MIDDDFPTVLILTWFVIQ